ncbi:MAG: nuclear transport factor 2 family protein [Sphingomonas sp.]|uniref:nuclear transport factor 2 family protein n=1 Tax=Sphingomonas sp. TaxID=28214 RepID=UPI00181467B0|nr:nuclear transport factor 2 family protein [Sphingomonas sp.]MBA3668238.1 nuclear transport factor 2 family protein [Sphingomonas sp.]
MKTAFLLAAIGIAASPAVASPSSDHASLIAAADAFDAAQIAKDGPRIARALRDDLVYIEGSGKRLGKNDFVAGWTAPGDRFDPLKLIDRTVTMLGGDAGVVGAEVNLCGTSGGERFCSRIRYADTFVRVGRKWRVAHIQVTRIKQ